MIANAVHFRALAAFYNGIPLAAEHPLVREEITPLLDSAGWRVLEINAIYDEAVGTTVPASIDMNSVRFNIASEPMLARGRVYAFLAVADAS